MITPSFSTIYLKIDRHDLCPKKCNYCAKKLSIAIPKQRPVFCEKAAEIPTAPMAYYLLLIAVMY